MAKQEHAQHAPGDPAVIRANINRTHERAASFVSLYANDAQVQTTPWDIRITFGAIGSAAMTTGAEDQAVMVVVRELAELHMSPQFAKRVTAVLIQQIQHYERTVGPIPMPEEQASED